MNPEPGVEAFSDIYTAGRAQVVWTRLIDDLETPVSAYLKLAKGRPYAFLFESVEGGAWRGRYSVIALKPDLVWRCQDDVAEIAEGEAIDAGRFTPQPGGALDSLRELAAASRLDLPAGLPPMTAGIFGAIGYDMIRLVERLPNVNPDPLGLPDAVMIRPSVVAVFDGIAQEILLATTVRPSGLSAQAAWEAAGRQGQEEAQDSGAAEEAQSHRGASRAFAVASGCRAASGAAAQARHRRVARSPQHAASSSCTCRRRRSQCLTCLLCRGILACQDHLHSMM